MEGCAKSGTLFRLGIPGLGFIGQRPKNPGNVAVPSFGKPAETNQRDEVSGPWGCLQERLRRSVARPRWHLSWHLDGFCVPLFLFLWRQGAARRSWLEDEQAREAMKHDQAGVSTTRRSRCEWESCKTSQTELQSHGWSRHSGNAAYLLSHPKSCHAIGSELARKVQA